MIQLEETWINKETKNPVVITWLSNDLVNFDDPLNPKTINTRRKFIFLQQYTKETNND